MTNIYLFDDQKAWECSIKLYTVYKSHSSIESHQKWPFFAGKITLGRPPFQGRPQAPARRGSARGRGGPRRPACHKQSFGVCWSSAAAASGRSCCSWVMAVMDGMIWGVPDTQQMDGFLMGKSQSINAGWWFGTLIPTDFHIVQRVKTTWIFFMIFDCLVVWNNNPNWRTHIFRRGRLKPPTSLRFFVEDPMKMDYGP